jgi:hypothetical protein
MLEFLSIATGSGAATGGAAAIAGCGAGCGAGLAGLRFVTRGVVLSPIAVPSKATANRHPEARAAMLRCNMPLSRAGRIGDASIFLHRNMTCW